MHKRLILSVILLVAAAAAVYAWRCGGQPFVDAGGTEEAVRDSLSASHSTSGDGSSSAANDDSSRSRVQSHSQVSPKVREFMDEIKRERDESNAKYRDQIDAIKAMPAGPEREKLIKSLRDECFNHDICGEDGAYLCLEMYKAEMERGNFHFLYIDMALDQYSNCAHDYDAQIELLNDVIATLEHRNFQVGTYERLKLKSNRDIEAAIRDLRKRIAQVEEEKMRSEEFANTGSYPERPVSAEKREEVEPGTILLMPGLSEAQMAVHEEAKEALYSRQYSKAVELWESIGDKENAAAALMVSGVADIEASFRAADEVVRKYPGTRQAALAGYRKAMLYKEAGRMPDFTKEMVKFVSEHPDLDCAGLGLAEMALQAQADKRVADTIQYGEQCDRWYREHRSTVSMMMLGVLADAYVKQGEWERADTLLSESLQAVKEERLHLAEADDELETATAVQRLEHFREELKMRAGQKR